jgi:predicted ATPase
MMDVFRRRPDETRSYANDVISICTEHDFPFWAAGGRILEGWAIGRLGKTDEGIKRLDEGLAAWRNTGARLWLPMFLALKAEAHAKAGSSDTALKTIDEALTVSDETGERWALAEVFRIKAGLLRNTEHFDPSEVENLLAESLAAGRRQHALSWQLRTACDLVNLLQSQSRAREALTLLKSIYDQFTEGFGTPDLIRAKTLLEAGHVR